MPESIEAMSFPMHGLNLVAEFERQPPGTTVTGKNVRAYDLFLQRMRGGSRPGLVEYIPAQVLGFASKIQHLGIIVDPTEAALTSGFFDSNDPDGVINDPSTNNRRVRNPGRIVRRHGSGKGLNIHLNGTKIKGQPTPPSGGQSVYPIPLPAGAMVISYSGVSLATYTSPPTNIGDTASIAVTRSYFDAQHHGHSDSANMMLTIGVNFFNNGTVNTGDFVTVHLPPLYTGQPGVGT